MPRDWQVHGHLQLHHLPAPSGGASEARGRCKARGREGKGISRRWRLAPAAHLVILGPEHFALSEGKRILQRWRLAPAAPPRHPRAGARAKRNAEVPGTHAAPSKLPQRRSSIRANRSAPSAGMTPGSTADQTWLTSQEIARCGRSCPGLPVESPRPGSPEPPHFAALVLRPEDDGWSAAIRTAADNLPPPPGCAG